MNILDMKLYLEDYLNDCVLRKRLSEKTMRAYRIDLKQFFDFMTTSTHEQKTIQEYIYMLNQRYTKYKTVKRKIASVKAFYAYLEYEEIIEFSPFRKIRTKIQEPKILPKTIHKENLMKIFELLYQRYENASTDFQKSQAMRNIAIVELLFSTGIRISELCHIQIKDIDFQEKILKIYGKGSKERIIYLGNEHIVDLLKRIIETNEKKEYLFYNRFHSILSEQSVRLMLKDIEEELGLETHITPHMFRHTFATTLLEKEVDIRYIQNILGHSSISTTQIYTHVSYSKQREIMISKNPMNDFKFNCLENR